MKAGWLRHRVTIQQKSESASAHLEMTDTWVDVATVWARIVPKSSAESMESDRTIGRITHEITIRARSDIGANMRVVFGSRYLYIDGPPRDFEERGIYQVFDCKETL